MNRRSLLVGVFASIACSSALGQSLPGHFDRDPWPQHGGNAQHQAQAPSRLQSLKRIIWTAPVDEAPQYSGTNLLIHYTTPLLTRKGTVVFPVKTSATGNYILDGRRSADGVRQWTMASDWVPTAAGWGPTCGACLVTNPANPTQAAAVIAGAGGKLFVRDFADRTTSTTRQIFFYDQAAYTANPAAFDSTVFINTPLTVDSLGNIYFGFQVTGANPLNLKSGIAKVNLSGVKAYTSILSATGGLVDGKVQTNCAPALGIKEKEIYFGINGGTPHLVSLRTSDLTPLAKVPLIDPNTGLASLVSDLSTASPMVGPDGKVFFGVLESALGSNHYRGWLLQFTPNLISSGAPGAFGWDDTPSMVPSRAVPSYTGRSSYLILSKYNHYATTGGDGMNKLAVLDPLVTQFEPVTSRSVMKEILTVVGITPDTGVGGVSEWCVNTAAVDVNSKCALVNSEDGVTYRWNFVTNTLSEAMSLNAGIGQAYTSTVIGPDGRGYAVSNGILHAVGS